jgi:hypothetical protein
MQKPRERGGFAFLDLIQQILRRFFGHALQPGQLVFF